MQVMALFLFASKEDERRDDFLLKKHDSHFADGTVLTEINGE